MARTKGNNSLILSEVAGQVDEEQTFQHQLRNAVFNAVNEQDVTDVVKGIVERAKEGDDKSVKHLFDYVLGAKTPVKLVQNNYYDGSDEDGPRPRIVDAG